MGREHVIKGSLYMTAAFFFLAINGAFFKAVTETVSSFWALWVAYSFAGLTLFAFTMRRGISSLKTEKFWGHFARTFFGLLAAVLNVITLNMISFLNASLLLNTAPLFIPLFAILLLRAKTSAKTGVFLCIGFIGVLFILNPDFASLTNRGNFLGLLAGTFQALAFVLVKMLTKTEPPQRATFYYYFLSVCLLTPYVLLSWESPPFQVWIYTLCAGAANLLFQLLMVKGYQYAEASHIGPFQYASVVFSGIIGWIVWSQTPTPFDLIGTLLVILGGAFTILFSPLPASKK